MSEINDGFEFDVALSFAGEDRPYVEAVAQALRDANISVFYDGFEEASLWGKNLYEHLSDVYGSRARFTIMFISRHYADKLWTSHERRAAQERALKEKSEYILPARFDSTEIPGLGDTVAYVSLIDRTPAEFARLVLSKLRPREPPGTDASSGLLSPAQGDDVQRRAEVSRRRRVLARGALIGAASWFLYALLHVLLSSEIRSDTEWLFASIFGTGSMFALVGGLVGAVIARFWTAHRALRLATLTSVVVGVVTFFFLEAYWSADTTIFQQLWTATFLGVPVGVLGGLAVGGLVEGVQHWMRAGLLRGTSHNA